MKNDSLLILGGGAIGLVTAYLAARTGRTVTVLEGSAQAGGLLATFPLGDSRLEHYYHHFFTHDAELRWLIDELDLRPQLQFLPASMGVFRDGRLFDFNGPRDILRFSPLGLVDKLRFAASSFFLGKFADWREYEGIPALDWFYRHAGRAATEAIWRPMLEIKFGSYAAQVPAAWIVGRLRQRLSSREDGDERLGYLQGSLQVLLDRLLAKLRELGVTVITNARVERLLVRNGKWHAVQTPAGEFSADCCLSTMPTVHLAPLLADSSPAFARDVGAIGYFGAVCTILEMDRPLSHTYWLNVADPGFPFGGIIEHTNFMPPAAYGGRHIAYLSRYFENTHALATAPKEEISRQMLAPLPRIYPGFQPDRILGVHVFRTLTAATVCGLNFSRLVPRCETPIRGFYLAAMAHVYPDERSCNNSIRVAAEACRVMRLESLQPPRGASLSGQIGMQ